MGDSSPTPLSTTEALDPWKQGAAVAAFGLFEGVWSLVFLVLMMLTPSRPENAVFLGLSRARLVGSAVLLCAAVPSFAGFALLRSGRDDWRRRASVLALAVGPWLSLGAVLAGAMIVITYVAQAGAFPTQAIARLAPFGVWLLGSGVALGIALIAMEGLSRRLVGFLMMAAIGLVGILVHTQVWPESESGSSDIYAAYEEGKRLAAGENPYERALQFDLGHVAKLPHNLPFFYHLAAVVQQLGLEHFGPWIAAWRMVFLGANLVIALAIFDAHWRVGIGGLGLVGALLWLLNRWTLHVSASGDLDFLALSCLVVSAVVLARSPRMSIILFGVSLAIRHMALGLAPIWLVSTWKATPSRQRMGEAVLLMAAAPVLTSLPLLLRNPNALLRSILNTWARPPEASGNVLSLDALLGIPPGAALTITVFLLAGLYLAVYRNRLGICAASMLALAVMISLGSVFFTSYLVWLIPFLSLAALEAAIPRIPYDRGVARAG